MNLREAYFDGKDGTSIFYLKDIPKSAKAIVIIAHGYMEHSGRYVEFAGKLVGQGYGVCIIDHRGNGRSGGVRGDVEDFFSFVTDIKCLVSALSVYKKPVITYGHSMGGLITFLYGLKYPRDLAGQIFSSPALAPPRMCNYIPEGFYKMMSYNFPQFKIKRGGINVAVKSREFKKMFKEDTRCNKYSTARFFDQFLRNGMTYASQNAIHYELPSLFMTGDRDFVIPTDAAEEVVGKISDIYKTTKKYTNCMHDLLHDDSHNVTLVIEDVMNWMNEILDTKYVDNFG
ncbi:MAG: hypothetical protein ATN35_11980 [Epulopiscium sp. Nele67-Bin004]|nr:MAG: hypothetical protein ATN35_11980 [Epulopiscium sp. Nele67-Bin004]